MAGLSYLDISSLDGNWSYWTLEGLDGIPRVFYTYKRRSYFSYRHLFFFFFQVFTYLGIRIDLLQYTSGSSINVGTAPNIHSRKRAKRHLGILVVLRAWAWCAIRVSVCDFISCFKRILLGQVSLLQLSENGRRLVWRGITFNCLLVGHKLSSIHLSCYIR